MTGAVLVKCYDTRLRKNVANMRNLFDVYDFTSTEGPARCVHVGTFPMPRRSLTVPPLPHVFSFAFVSHATALELTSGLYRRDI